MVDSGALAASQPDTSVRDEVRANDTLSKYADLVDVKMVSQSMKTSTQLTNGNRSVKNARKDRMCHIYSDFIWALRAIVAFLVAHVAHMCSGQLH